MKLICPNCRSNRVNVAHGPFDWLLRMFGRTPYRCGLCGTRFNPDPKATVEYGQQTASEMVFGFYFYTRDDQDLNLRIDPRTGGPVGS